MGHSGTIFGDSEIARLAQAGAAVAIIDSTGSLILWSTPAAANYFGLQNGEVRGVLDDTIWPVERFAALAEGEAPLAGMALEPLQTKDSTKRPVTMSVRRSHLHDQSAALVVVLLSLRGAAVEPPTHFEGGLSPADPMDNSPIRFLWHTDLMGLWHFSSDTRPSLNPLLELLDGATWPGRNASRIHDFDNALRNALSQQETFVGLDVELTTQSGDRMANVILSGTPVISPVGIFEGYRGFGFYKPIFERTSHEVNVETLLPEDDLTVIAPDRPQLPLPEPVTIVAPDEPEKLLAPIKSPISKSGLSEAERLAFREIARALGAKPVSETAKIQITPGTHPESVSPPPSSAIQTSPKESIEQPKIFERATDKDQHEKIDQLIAEAAERITKESRAAANERPSSSLHIATELVRLVLDRLPVGVLISRGDVPIVMNETLLDWLGYHDADEFHAYGGIDRLFRGRVPSHNALSNDDSAMLVTRKDGTTIALSTRLQTMQWGDLPASMMTFNQIEEPRADLDRTTLLETGLVEAHELKAILDTATDGVIVMDEQGHILSLNRSAEALFGIEEISLLGDKFTALFSDETRQRASDYFNGIKENGVATVLNDGREVTGLDDSGRKIPLFITLGRVADSPSSKYCAVLRDITAFKQTERELLEAKRKAETQSTLKSDFLAKISHEVRTPLSAIIGFAEIMYEERFGPLGTTRYKDYLKDILKSGAHVVNLINDLLDLSKIEAGRADLDFATIQPNAIVASSVKLLQNEAARRRVILRQSLAGNLPGVIADERSLTQIMLNILSNAIKFTDEGGQVIVSTARTVKGDLVIRVKDTGVGMSDQELRTALEPFRQIKTSRHTGGTGLGLPLTKALVEANRASMTIISAKNAGTLVEITFPSTRVLTA